MEINHQIIIMKKREPAAMMRDQADIVVSKLIKPRKKNLHK
jgi:hypothetical protein